MRACLKVYIACGGIPLWYSNSASTKRCNSSWSVLSFSCDTAWSRAYENCLPIVAPSWAMTFPVINLSRRAINADFRRLKFTHNGTHVLDEVTGTRKLQCEVFFPLPLTIAESHCTRLSGSSVRFREAMMR